MFPLMIQLLNFLIFNYMSHSSEVKNLWDKNTENYDVHMQETGHYEAQKKILESLIQYIDSPILDIASGPGYLDGLLLKKGYEVTFNDFSSEMVSLSKQKYDKYPNAKFENTDADELTLDGKYHTIICCNLFYYLPNRAGAIESWIEHLTEDGNIIVIEEYPFQRPSTPEMSESESELMRLIDPITSDEIKKYFEVLNLVSQSKTSIDKQHDLYGYVFAKKD